VPQPPALLGEVAGIAGGLSSLAGLHRAPRAETRPAPRHPGGDPAAPMGSEPGKAGLGGWGVGGELPPSPGIWAPVADPRPGWRDRPRLGGASSSAAVNSAGTARGWKMDINRGGGGEAAGAEEREPGSPRRQLPAGGVRSFAARRCRGRGEGI